MPRTPAAVMAPVQVHRFIETLVKGDLHAARVRSLANGVIGGLHAATLGVAAIGRGLAAAQGLCDKHAIKQTDRLLGNSAIDVRRLTQATSAPISRFPVDRIL